jgi:hypothetical protein
MKYHYHLTVITGSPVMPLMLFQLHWDRERVDGIANILNAENFRGNVWGVKICGDAACLVEEFAK